MATDLSSQRAGLARVRAHDGKIMSYNARFAQLVLGGAGLGASVHGPAVFDRLQLAQEDLCFGRDDGTGNYCGEERNFRRKLEQKPGELWVDICVSPCESTSGCKYVYLRVLDITAEICAETDPEHPRADPRQLSAEEERIVRQVTSDVLARLVSVSKFLAKPDVARLEGVERAVLGVRLNARLCLELQHILRKDAKPTPH